MKNLLFLNMNGAEILLFVVPVALIIYCLADIFRSDFKDSSSKFLWIIVVLITPLLGSLLYLAFGRKSKVGLSS